MYAERERDRQTDREREREILRHFLLDFTFLLIHVQRCYVHLKGFGFGISINSCTKLFIIVK